MNGLLISQTNVFPTGLEFVWVMKISLAEEKVYYGNCNREAWHRCFCNFSPTWNTTLATSQTLFSLQNLQLVLSTS